MPIQFTLDEPQRLLRFELTGEWDTAEMLAVTHEAYAAAAQHHGFDILSDNRGNATVATPEQVRKLAELMVREGASFAGRRAAIVVDSAASYGMIRMLAARAAPLGLEVCPFFSMEEAVSFLREPRPPQA
jgi:hypothetical protein